jgi:hypothetical protein
MARAVRNSISSKEVIRGSSSNLFPESIACVKSCKVVNTRIRFVDKIIFETDLSVNVFM